MGRLGRFWDLSATKIIDSLAAKPRCKECGFKKELIFYFLEISKQHLPPDLLYSEKSMDSLELKTYLCAIYNHVVDPFNKSTTTRLSALKEQTDKETGYQACTECGIHQEYVSTLLDLSMPYLTNDDTLLDRINGTNDRCNHGNITDEELHQFMLRMYFGWFASIMGYASELDASECEDDT